MLGNATGFSRGDVRLADDVQQGRFAMIDVAHDGHHRGARGQVLRFVFDVQLEFPDRRVDQAAAALAFFQLEAVAVFGADPLGDHLVDRLVDIGEDTRFHQVGDDLEWLLFELFGQFAHDNGRLDRNDFRVGRQDNF